MGKCIDCKHSNLEERCMRPHALTGFPINRPCYEQMTHNTAESCNGKYFVKK